MQGIKSQISKKPATFKMRFVEVAAPFTCTFSLYLFLATYMHVRKDAEAKSMLSIKVLRLVSISIINVQMVATTAIVICTKLGVDHGILVDYFEKAQNSTDEAVYVQNSTGEEKSAVRSASYSYKLVSVFFVLLYRVVIEFMLVSRVKVIFRKAPVSSKFIERKCTLCISVATLLAVIQFVSNVTKAVINFERKYYFLMMTVCHGGNTSCKLYFVHCSLVAFKCFKKLATKASKLAFKRRKSYVRRMKVCMILYFVCDVTLIFIGGALKAFNREKYDDQIFIVVCLFFNCLDFAILLGTYKQWRRIFTLYAVNKRVTKEGNSQKQGAISVVETTDVSKAKVLPVAY